MFKNVIIIILFSMLVESEKYKFYRDVNVLPYLRDVCYIEEFEYTLNQINFLLDNRPNQDPDFILKCTKDTRHTVCLGPQNRLENLNIVYEQIDDWVRYECFVKETAKQANITAALIYCWVSYMKKPFTLGNITLWSENCSTQGPADCIFTKVKHDKFYFMSYYSYHYTHHYYHFTHHHYYHYTHHYTHHYYHYTHHYYHFTHHHYYHYTHHYYHYTYHYTHHYYHYTHHYYHYTHHYYHYTNHHYYHYTHHYYHYTNHHYYHYTYHYYHYTDHYHHYYH